jgi:hypothetical protein
MKAYGGVDVQTNVFLNKAIVEGKWPALLPGKVWGCGRTASPFLTSGLDRDDWSAHAPGRFTAGESTPGPTGQVWWVAGPVWML